MRPARSVNRLLLLITVGVLVSTIGIVERVSAVPPTQEPPKEVWTSEGRVAGQRGYADSLAVASFFSVKGSSGAGAFSGTVGGVQTSGLFSLTVNNPANAPVLPCPTGRESAGGSVTSGSFLGEQVLVAGCIGSGVPEAFIIYHSTPSNPDFSGLGTGTVITSKVQTIRSGAVAAGATSGSGSAGSGTIYTAEADAVTNDGSLIGGGAFVGTISDSPVGSTWIGNRVTFQSGCTMTTSGVTASFGSFPNQPVSSRYTLMTCPPTSTGAQTARFVYVLGGDASPVYKGTGNAQIIGDYQAIINVPFFSFGFEPVLV